MSDKSTRNRKLTPDQKEFLKLYGLLIQNFNVPRIGKIFGVTKQSVQYQIDKGIENDEN